MKDLPTVSIIAYDNTDLPEKTLIVIQYCQRFFNFGEAILVCRKIPQNGPEDVKIVQCDEQGYNAAMLFEFTLGKFVSTEYSLFVSHDGCILNPGKWNDEWLNYDFVGGPWPEEVVIDPRWRVGNTGFCLRSRKFMDLCFLAANIYRDDCPADVFACQVMRRLFEEGCGIKFAPIDVAADFSWDMDIPEYPGGRPDAFGGHKKRFMMTA